MLRIAALLLALVPLLGVVWIFLYGSPTTVDGLFLILILLAISGILGATGLYGIYKSRQSGATVATSAPSPHGGLVQRGRVESVTFYEAEVGRPNKSLVTLAGADQQFRLLLLEGDVRNALPVGQQVEFTYRKDKDNGSNVLGNVRYA
ncbi:MAG: hypothetical protein JST79_07120 [Acidobacteria bacterium]|nr:hypothetical protein [Acidobacteriota bacterium]